VNVRGPGLTDNKFNIAVVGLVEVRGSGTQAVGRRPEIADDERTLVIGGNGARIAGSLVSDRDGCTRHHGASLVADRPEDTSLVGLADAGMARVERKTVAIRVSVRKADDLWKKRGSAPSTCDLIVAP
jgi:hypothetical protein